MTRWTEQDVLDAQARRAAGTVRVEPKPVKACALAGSRKIGTKNLRGMNKSEAQFAQKLEFQKVAGDIVWWGFEPIRIRLANGTFYRPDFVTVDKNGRTAIYEVKGYMREAARVRLKVAVEKLPYPFFLVRKHKGELRVTPV